MRKLIRAISRIMFWMIGLLAFLVLTIVLFMTFAPQVGQKPKGERLERISKSSNYGEDQFVNLLPTGMGNFSDMLSLLPEYFAKRAFSPADPIPTAFDTEQAKQDTNIFITWYGHSSFLIEIDEKRILVDPMFSESPTPFGVGSSRFDYEEGIPIDDIDHLDAIVISHDHYDHLDYKTIKILKGRSKAFVTPLGVGSHLERWGVDSSKITELDWWQETSLGGIRLVACPSRHFSGRGLTDRNATQWASWVFSGEHGKVYFSGDGGYGPHFKEVGERFGPFDIGLMECGQYNEHWAQIHMMPEESVRAGMEVRAKTIMPVHWGAFQLALHEWKDPIVRFTSEAELQGQDYIHPVIGERFEVGKDQQKARWWESL